MQAKALLAEDDEESQDFPLRKPEKGPENANVLVLDDPEELKLDIDDPFQAQMMVPHAPVRADRRMLRKLKQSSVIIRKCGHTLFAWQSRLQHDSIMKANNG